MGLGYITHYWIHLALLFNTITMPIHEDAPDYLKTCEPNILANVLKHVLKRSKTCFWAVLDSHNYSVPSVFATKFQICE